MYTQNMNLIHRGTRKLNALPPLLFHRRLPIPIPIAIAIPISIRTTPASTTAAPPTPPTRPPATSLLLARAAEALGDEVLAALEVVGEVEQLGVVAELLEDVDRFEGLAAGATKQFADLWARDKEPIQRQLQW